MDGNNKQVVVQRTAELDAAARLRLERDRRRSMAENLRRLGNALVDKGQGPLDIVQRTPGVHGFDELDRAAVDADLLSVPVRVCSLAHLRRMEEARGNSQDLADLDRLPAAD